MNITIFSKSIVLSFTCVWATTVHSADNPPEQRAENRSAQQQTKWSDQQIQGIIEQRFEAQNAIPAHAVDVAVENGVVTLSGKIQSYSAKRAASESAAAIRGVENVRNNITVMSNGQPADNVLEQHVRDAFSEEISTGLDSIDVNVQDGQLILTGQVDSFQEKTIATDVGAEIAGITGIQNKLTVKQVESRPDSELETDIKNRIAWDTLVNENDIQVDVREGIAHISGTVDSASEKRRIIQDAWLTGVNQVQATDLTVKPVTKADWTRWANRDKSDTRSTGASASSEKGTTQSGLTGVDPEDVKLRKAVQQRLAQNTRLKDDQFTVEVNAGLATVRGKVDTIAEKQEVSRTAGETVGVIRVYNFTKVRPEEPVTDQEIMQKLRAAFERDPYLQENELNISATNSKVWLSGEVDSKFERTRASMLVAKIPGVLAIDNSLKADPPIITSMYYSVTPLYVAGPYTWSDMEIQQNVENQMFWSPFVDADEVQVSVDKSAVTLTGVVDSWAEKRAAEENAYEAGATEVYNQLNIGDPGLL